MKSVRKLAQIFLVVVLGLLAAAAPAFAVEGYDGHDRGSINETPEELKDIGIEENLGAQVDMGLTFRDETGQTVALSQFAQHKPVLLTLAYYGCPGLCNYHLNGLNDAFRELKEPLGKEFDVVVVSIEPKETPELASKKKDAYIKAYGRVEGAKGWHFLTGDEENIRKLAQTVGFKYRWDEKQKQYAHAAAAYVLTPEGKVSRYLKGITFDSKILRLSLVEASDGKIGTLLDKVTLFCFHLDTKASKLTIAAFNVMRAGAGLTVLVLAGFLVPFWFRSRRGGGGSNGRGSRPSNLEVQGEA